MIGDWLVDKSALVRIGRAAPTWESRIERGLLCISSITKLEVGHSARSEDDFGILLDRPPLSNMPVLYLTPRVEDRALDVHRLLCRVGHHRGPSVADLLLAAMAEVFELTLLHVDSDFDVIAEVTGQPVERLVTSDD